jgi:structural maintenance of chromosome 4
LNLILNINLNDNSLFYCLIFISPENSKRIFDYIQILDQRFRLTFYSGVYDTLLAEDLEQARRIAFGTQTRYRVVTYKGDLIDQSGM